MAPSLQISIPTTSTGEEGGKAYTLYHVQLALPIRTHETRKRYSDFTSLHDSLVSQTGAAPPASLPPKSWLRRTVDNPALTEQRRRGLEAYVRAIVDAQDARWRSSAVWRHFLGLPQDDKQHKIMQAKDSVVDPAAWLDLHRDVKGQLNDARQLLKKRDAAATAQEQHAISANAKAALVRAATGLARLDDALSKTQKKTKDDDDGGWGQSSRLGEGEIRRRRDMIGLARAETESLESNLKSLVVKPQGSMLSATSAAAAASDSDKRALWGDAPAARSSRRVLGGPAQETDRTRELDNQGVLQLQKQVMGEQEQDVLAIGQAVTRMKQMGIMINEELVIQNEMLTMMDQDVDRVQGKIDIAKKRIKKIN
ncbi:Phox-like protein [Aureobasidium subglaciale]|nr:Phox-like protein [Aureobasidium subglaciale]